MNRTELLLAGIARDARLLEVGPSFSPLAPKRDGWNTFVIDHLDRQGLIAKYREHPGVDVTRIEEVDSVWQRGRLTDCVNPSLHGSFDVLLGSHVLEHMPDFVDFLDSAGSLLRPDGVVSMALPDKRFCFDFFRPISTTGSVLDANDQRRSRHSPGAVFDHFSSAVRNGGLIAWSHDSAGALNLIHTLEQTRQLYETSLVSDEYVDTHAWQFTPKSFELLLFDLCFLERTDWQIQSLTPSTGCEFYVRLCRGGQASIRQLASGAVQTRRLSLLKGIMEDLQVAANVPSVPAEVASPSLAAARADLEPAQNTNSPELNSYFVDWRPDVKNGARLFEGEWSSAVPGLPTGKTALFEDARLDWFEERLGGFAGHNVLELGPLEGGHTYMMTRRGATVLAIESNTRAWLRCLVVKEAVGMPGSTFLLGDFNSYLEDAPQFTFTLASGVLYHQTDPVGFLEKLTKTAPCIAIWTHYFDADLLRSSNQPSDKFSVTPRLITSKRGRDIQLFDQRYLEALGWKGFCGGSAPGSSWLCREDIIAMLGDEGFSCEIGFDHPDHPNGPAFCVFARKTR